MSKLEIKNLYKRYGEVTVLDNINIKVEDGEFLVLVGPSGSGKSTILRIIAGLDAPTSGEIFLNEKSINHLLPKDRDIAMVFQNYALYPHMSVFDNIAFPLKMQKSPTGELVAKVNETANLLGIKSHLNKKPKDLSGGERQRVALGRAIIRKPKLFLMDEPLSNLDAKLRTQMRTELLNLHRSLLSTVVYVTHDQIEALTMGSKIVVLNYGIVQQVDTPVNIYNMPANTFVASFIGNPGMNILDFKAIDSNTVEIFGNKTNLVLPESFLTKLKKNNCLNKKIFLGIRPENILINQNAGINFNASVNIIEMLGSEYLIHSSFQNLNSKKLVSVKSLFAHNLKPGDQFAIGIDTDRAYLFDSDTGLLLKS